MARPRKKADDRLMSLSEVARRTGISMPTLLRYKKNFAARIPSSGKGRTQRYPEAALAVITQLKAENLAKRGRRRTAGSAQPAASRRRSGRTAASGLLSLSEVGRRTGISYPTLLRYVSLHLDRLPHAGSGRTRRFRPEAVPVFAELRRSSRRGRKPAGERAAIGSARGPRGAAASPDLMRRLERIERGQAELRRDLAKIRRSLDRPLRVSVRR
jgi:DNA-binding transcriptional MerR regulator